MKPERRKAERRTHTQILFSANATPNPQFRRIGGERRNKLPKKLSVGWRSEWGFHLRHDWYDGPYWDFQLGPLVLFWNLDGLPYIFQSRPKP